MLRDQQFPGCQFSKPPSFTGVAPEKWLPGVEHKWGGSRMTRTLGFDYRFHKIIFGLTCSKALIISSGTVARPGIARLRGGDLPGLANLGQLVAFSFSRTGGKS